MIASLPLLAILVPLLLAPLALQLGRPLRLLPWAALPALAAALLTPQGRALELTALLPGAALELDSVGALFLGCAAVVWLLAGAQAITALADDRRAGMFAAGWLLTLAGAVGAFVAADAVTYYASFSVMSLSAWLAVIHRRSEDAVRAGRAYLVLAVLGEALLLTALVLAAGEADSLRLEHLRDAVAGSPVRDWIVAGLIGGLGIKAGLVPLHAWLPLAHPVAPGPASAVLSGVLVKVGLFGLLRLLPIEDGAAMAGGLLIGLGLLSVFYGALVGLVQTLPKRVLAYSTVSHAGLAAIALGAGVAFAQADQARAVAAFYAAHEGLSKGALFLLVGVAAGLGRRWRTGLLVGATVLALGAVGLPLTGGATMKYALKQLFADTPLAWALTLSTVAGALLMLRFLLLVHRLPPGDHDLRRAAGMLVPWAALAAVALVLPWLVASPLATGDAPGVLAPATLWSALWPIGLAVVLGAAWMGWHRPVVPSAPDAADSQSTDREAQPKDAAVPAWRPWARVLDWLLRWRGTVALARLERPLRRWPVAGPSLLLVAAALATALTFGR